MTKTEIRNVDDSAVVQTVLQRLDRLRERKATLLTERASVPSGGAADRLTSEALADGKTFPDFTAQRQRADRHLAATASAVETEQARLVNVRQQAALEIRQELSAQRHAILKRLDDGTAKTLAAIDALNAFGDECELSGISTTGAPWMFCGLAAPGLMAGQMREALQEWRQEFAETQFTTEVAHYEQARANIA